MTTFKFTITIECPEGSTMTLVPTAVGTKAGAAADPIPVEVRDAIERFVPSLRKQYVYDYLSGVTDLGCTIELGGGGRANEYLSVFPPDRCRRARVSGLTYRSTRTAIFCGATDLQGFAKAEKTFNGKVYVYPKLSKLDSKEAVKEAIALSAKAIARLER